MQQASHSKLTTDLLFNSNKLQLKKPDLLSGFFMIITDAVCHPASAAPVGVAHAAVGRSAAVKNGAVQRAAAE